MQRYASRLRRPPRPKSISFCRSGLFGTHKADWCRDVRRSCPCTHNSADFLARTAGIKIIEQVAKRSELIIALVAVYSVIDCDIANIALRKKALGVVANFQIIASHTGHIFNDNRLDLSGFCKPYHLIPTGSIKRNARNAVVNEKCGIEKSIVSCILKQNLFLRCNV